MRLPALAALLVLPLTAYAQYYSEGWKPGQPTTRQVPTASFGTDGFVKPTPTEKGNIIEQVLTKGPVASLLAKAGLNVTKAAAKGYGDIWDLRIPIISDLNYEEIIVNETMTAAEEENRVWFILITAGATKDALSTFADEQFDEAYNITLEANDLPHVRFARINYMDVTYLTTKWVVWKAPVIVILTDRGKTLRFFTPRSLYFKAQAFHDFLESGAWEETKPWSSAFAPGGSREFLLEGFSRGLTVAYNFLSRVPKLVLLVLTGGVTTVILNFLHRNDPNPEVAKPARPATEKATVSAAPATASQTLEVPSSPESKRSSPRKRKGKN